MAKRASEGISRRNFLGVTIGTAVVAGVGCGTDNGNGGGTQTSGGTTGMGTGTGIGNGTGGLNANGGVTGNGTSASTGGVTPIGTGTETGGANATGGATGDGGATADGGTSSAGGSTGIGGSKATGGTTGAGGTTGGGIVEPTSPYVVSMVRNTDAIKATMDAIAAIGGFPNLTGKVVMLRPNAIDTAPPGSVNPDVIRGVIRAIKLAGNPSSILVADDAFTGATLTRMATNGIRPAAEAEGATCLELKGGTTTLITIANTVGWASGMPFYKAVLDADYIVNIPVCKTHGSANFSMALKGWYGNVPQTARNQNHSNVATISHAMPDMHLAKKENFVVLDATKCLLTGGPQVNNGTVASPGIVVASRDAIATDVTGVCILKHYLQQTGTANNRISGTSVWAQPQIARAMTLTKLGWLTSKQNFPFTATGITEADTIMAYRA